MADYAADGPNWVVLNPARSVVVADVQMSFETLLAMPEPDRNGYGIFEVIEPAPPPAGKDESSRTIENVNGKPVYVAVYANALPVVMPVPVVISDRQFAQVLALDGVISQNEALAWAARGDLPQRLIEVLSHIPEDGGQRFGAQMMLSAATTYERSHPLVPVLGALLGMDAAALDSIWIRGAAL